MAQVAALFGLAFLSWLVTTVHSELAISVPCMKPYQRIVCKHSFNVLSECDADHQVLNNVTSLLIPPYKSSHSSKILEEGIPAWLGCDSHIFQAPDGRWKQQPYWRDDDQPFDILVGLGSPTQLASACPRTASQAVHTHLPSSYTNVGQSPNGHYLAVIEESDVLGLLMLVNGSWQKQGQRSLSASDSRFNPPYLPLMVNDDGTVLVANYQDIRGFIARMTFNNVTGVTLNSTAAYFDQGNHLVTMQPALNHRQDVLVLLNAEIARLEGVSGALPPPATIFSFGSYGALALAWSPDDEVMFGLFGIGVRTYDINPKLGMLRVKGKFVPGPYEAGVGSIAVGRTHVYISIQAVNTTDPVQVFFAPLNDDGVVSGEFQMLIINGALATAPLAICNDALLVPTVGGLQMLYRTPLGLKLLSHQTGIDWNSTRVVAVDPRSCQATLWSNDTLLSLGLGCDKQSIEPYNTTIVAWQLLADSTLLFTRADMVSVAWGSDTTTLLKQQPLLSSKNSTESYADVVAPSDSHGTYAVAIATPATILLGYQGIVQSEIVLDVDAAFKMVFTGPAMLAVAYNDVLHCYTTNGNRSLCATNLSSSACPSLGPPLSLLAAANDTLVVIRNSTCDAVWVLSSTSSPDICYQRSGSNTTLPLHVQTSSLDPNGRFLYLVGKNTAMPWFQLYRLDVATLELIFLQSLASHSGPFSLSISSSLCAVASADRILVYQLPDVAFRSQQGNASGLAVHSELLMQADAVILSVSGSFLYTITHGLTQLTAVKLRRWTTPSQVTLLMELQNLPGETFQLVSSDAWAALIARTPGVMHMYTVDTTGKLAYQQSQENMCSISTGKVDLSLLVDDVLWYTCRNGSSITLGRLVLHVNATSTPVLQLMPASMLVLELESSRGVLRALTNNSVWQSLNSTTLVPHTVAPTKRTSDCTTYLQQQAVVRLALAVSGTNTTILPSLDVGSTVLLAYQLKSNQWLARLARKQDIPSRLYGLDYQAVPSVTLPWLADSLSELESLVQQCPAVEWLSSSSLAFQQDGKVHLRQNGQTTVYPGFILPAAGVDVLVTADNQNLLEASWLELRSTSTLDLLNRLELRPSPISKTFAAMIPSVAAVWTSDQLQLLFAADNCTSNCSSAIFTLQEWGLPVDLVSLGENVLKTQQGYVTPKPTLSTTPSSITTPEKRTLKAGVDHIVIIAVTAGCVAVLALVLLGWYYMRHYRGVRAQLLQNSDEDKQLLEDEAELPNEKYGPVQNDGRDKLQVGPVLRPRPRASQMTTPHNEALEFLADPEQLDSLMVDFDINEDWRPNPTSSASTESASTESGKGILGYQIPGSSGRLSAQPWHPPLSSTESRQSYYSESGKWVDQALAHSVFTAICLGHDTELGILLQQGFDLETLNSEGESSFIAAARYDNAIALHMLLQFEPKQDFLETLDNSGHAFTHWLAKLNGAAAWRILPVSIRRDILPILDAQGRTVLHLAAYAGNLEFLKAVFSIVDGREAIEAKSLLLLHDNEHLTPLDYAKMAPSEECCAFLLQQAGNPIKADVKELRKTMVRTRHRAWTRGNRTTVSAMPETI
eukprot:m.175364 g.175364  ORF g.175364 m.175364 type:complete len:1568 (+) comp16777_c0_seq2:392-5095(+)